MNGFGFIEYKDAMDARDVVPGKLLLTRRNSTQPNPFQYLGACYTMCLGLCVVLS